MAYLSIRLRARLLAIAVCLVSVSPSAQQPGDRTPPSQAARPQEQRTTDLDAFMAQVLARRDENWRKLQQYVLDERERAELRGPAGTRLYGLEREYAWYIRDGVFVRSPVRFDGVALSEPERQEYERRWIERQRRREAGRSGVGNEAGGSKTENTENTKTGKTAQTPAAHDVDALLRLTREPQFVSAAYFLRFKFEPGRYALVGREAFEGQTVLRIEYYPSRLYDDDDAAEHGKAGGRRQDDEEARLEQQMNKVALVTLWVEPEAHQIVKYTFDNVGFDFLPGRSFVRVEDVRASMQMGQPFPGVWLPRAIDGHGAFTLANGTYEVKYDLEYANYRLADVKVRLR